jgi:hypothetical protein
MPRALRVIHINAANDGQAAREPLRLELHRDPETRRLEWWEVSAQGTLEPTGTPHARTVREAEEIAAQVWAGPSWSLQWGA